MGVQDSCIPHAAMSPPQAEGLAVALLPPPNFVVLIPPCPAVEYKASAGDAEGSASMDTLEKP